MSVAAVAVLLSAPAVAAEPQTLEQAMVLAYRNNPALQAEQAKLRAVDEQVSEAESGWRPSIDATTGIGKAYLSSGEQGNADLSPHSIGATVTQPVFKGFRTVGGIGVAEANVQAERANLQSAEQQLLLDVGTAYLDVVQAGAMLELNANNENVLRKQAEYTKGRFEAGEVTRTDVSQAESRFMSATAARIQAEGALASVRATYARLVGDMPGTLAQPEVDLPNDVKNLDDVIARAESQNPSIIAASFAERSAHEQVGVSEGALLPEVNLVGSVSRGWQQTLSVPGRQDSSQIMAEITVPLYRSGADYARTREALQTESQMRLQREDFLGRVRESAIGAWNGLTSTRAALGSDQAAVDAADLALQGVRAEATVGTRTTLDVLNSEQDLQNARAALIHARHDEAVSVLQTRAAIGELTAAALNLPVTPYDPTRHYDEARGKWIGFGG